MNLSNPKKTLTSSRMEPTFIRFIGPNTWPLLLEQKIAGLQLRYAEPQRHYHVWQHIASMLEMAEEIRDRLENPLAVLIALLYHDAIYDPQSTENETASAELMRAELQGDLSDQDLRQAGDMILCTQSHELPVTKKTNLDTAYFLDLDLAILGACENEFRRYDVAIRKEYAYLPDADYKAGRKAVIQGFLGRERIFYSDHFRARFEESARANLAKALDALS